MKRIAISIAIATCTAICANAQKISVSVEAFGGAGLSYVKSNVGAAVVANYGISKDFSLGVGTGANFTNSLYGHLTLSDKVAGVSDREYDYYHKEILAPVFARAKFVISSMNFAATGTLNPFVAIDGGYNFNLLSNSPGDSIEASMPEKARHLKTAKGLFYIPQIGLESERIFLSVGLNVQNFEYKNATRSISKDQWGKEQIYENALLKDNFSQALVFRIGYKF